MFLDVHSTVQESKRVSFNIFTGELNVFADLYQCLPAPHSQDDGMFGASRLKSVPRCFKLLIRSKQKRTKRISARRETFGFCDFSYSDKDLQSFAISTYVAVTINKRMHR